MASWLHPARHDVLGAAQPPAAGFPWRIALILGSLTFAGIAAVGIAGAVINANRSAAPAADDAAAADDGPGLGDGCFDAPVAPPPPPVADGPVAGGGLAGIWQGTGFDLVGNQVFVEIVIQDAGTFSQTESGQIGNFYQAGRWGIVGDGLIRLTIDEYFPTEFCGPLGCEPVRLAETATITYRLLDGMTLEIAGSDGQIRRFQRVG